jgi:hypothetical protein
MRYLVAVIVLLLCAGNGAQARDAAATATMAAPLASVDAFFLTAYGRAVQKVLPDEPPAFLVLPSRLVLYRAGTRRDWPLIPPLFNELKTVAHVTLGLFAVLSPSNGAALGADDAVALRRYQSEIAVARDAIQRVNFSAAQRPRQEQILAASQALSERALADGRMSADDLTAFCRRMRPLVEANIGEAVHAYLDELNRRMAEALPQLSAPERGEYLVIVSGVHQARIDNAAMQYFNRLMNNPPVITQRLMYAENVFDEAGALHLLGIHRMARRVGRSYFDDPYYMNRDLFAPAAAAYVPTLQLPQ